MPTIGTMKTLVKFFALLFVFICCSNTVRSTPVSPCTNNNASLPEVEILDCDDLPCTFYINAKGVMTMAFKSPRYLEHIAPRATADVLGINNIPYPLSQSDACDGITNTPCPLAEGEYIEYKFEMFILPVFPQVALTFQFSLDDVDRNNEPFECFRADIQLKKAS